MASIIWTENALNDIDNIASYISKDSEFYAKQFVKKLINTTLKLESFPEIGKTIRELHNQITEKFFIKNTGLFIELRQAKFT